MLDQKPSGSSRILTKASRADQDPQTLEFFPLKCELNLSILQRFVHIGSFRLPGSLVPQHHYSRSIFAGRDYSLKFGILDGMIFRLHREALYRRIERGTFRDCPREENTAPLQTKIVMQMRGDVLLHNVNQRVISLLLHIACAARLWCRAEVTLLAVLFEFHMKLAQIRCLISKKASRSGFAFASVAFQLDFFGTLAPLLRASERPIAIACSRDLIFPPFPPLPERSVPIFSRCKALSTPLLAASPYPLL